MEACTIIARNYLPFARALAESLRLWEPDVRLSVLVLDAPADMDLAGEAFDLVRPEDLDLDRTRFHQMAMIYDVTELSTALKPWLLTALLDRGANPVVYLDPDIYLYGHLTGVAERAAQTALLLTPHMTSPVSLDSAGVREVHVLRTGGFNLGFIAVSQASLPFLDWWKERLERHCIRDVNNSLFVDQRWIDMAIHYFLYDVIRDTSFNVAYWNLPTRDLTVRDGSYYVDGSPLTFFHFSGFDPHSPLEITTHWPAFTRHPPPQSEVVVQVLQGYADRLKALGLDEWLTPYGFGRSSSGLRLDLYLRRAYRKHLLNGVQNLPDAFEPGDAARFEAWSRSRLREAHARQVAVRLLHLARRPILWTIRALGTLSWRRRESDAG